MANWSPTTLVDINLGIRILLGSSFYEDWQNEETFVKTDPLGNAVDQHHPWNQTTTPRPQKRDFNGNYTWVMSPRWYHKRTGEHLALDTGGGPIARLWSTALSGLVNIGYIQSTGHSVKINLPKGATLPETTFEWKIPKWSNAIERDRARTYFQAYAAAAALYFCEKAMDELLAGHSKTWTPFEVPQETIACGFHEAVRGVLSHHVVIRDGKIANYHPYPPTCWNANPRDVYGTPGPYEDAVQNTPHLRGERSRQLQGHRHHAGGAQLRSMPALRRSHVPGRRQSAGNPALAHVRPGGGQMSALGNSEFQAYTGRIERLVERAGALEDAAARTTALDLLQSVMDLHGAAVSRIVELLDATEAGRASLASLGADPLICGLLVLYGVHPVPLEERIARALENLAPQLRKHSGSAELIGIAEGVVRVKLESSGHGCGTRPRTLSGPWSSRPFWKPLPRPSKLPSKARLRLAASGFVPLNLIQPAPKSSRPHPRRKNSMKNPPRDLDAHTARNQAGRTVGL